MAAPHDRGVIHRDLKPQNIMMNQLGDGAGCLRLFSAMPYGIAEDVTQPVAPETVFHAAGLDMTRFTETQPTILPHSAADLARMERPSFRDSEHEVSVEIAAWKGRITRAQLIYSIRSSDRWRRPQPTPEPDHFAVAVGAACLGLSYRHPCLCWFSVA